MIKQGLFICVCAAILISCGTDSPVTPPPLPDPTCEGLYGDPNMNTGLSTDVCFARIEGVELWTPRVWDDAAIAELRSWTLENPPTVPTEDPYLTTPDLQPDEDAACAFMVTGEQTYRLETFESAIAAEIAGGIVTHGGACAHRSGISRLMPRRPTKRAPSVSAPWTILEGRWRSSTLASGTQWALRRPVVVSGPTMR